MRYCGVSVINVLVGQGVLAFCLIVLEFGGVVSQIISVVISAIPAYFLSRQWVWKQDGEVSFRNEVLPFWGMALLGSCARRDVYRCDGTGDRPAARADGDQPRSVRRRVGRKYVILDKVMWRTEPSATT